MNKISTIILTLTLAACSPVITPTPLPIPTPTPSSTPIPTPIPTPTPDPTPIPIPNPTPTPTGESHDGWIYGPIHVGGYAWTTVNQSPYVCCRGLIWKVISGPAMSSDSVPVPMWQLQFYSDVTGNFPLDSIYATSINWWQEKDIQGLDPSKLGDLHAPMWNKELIETGSKVRVVKTCPSIYENSETLRNGIAEQGVIEGEIYNYVSWGYTTSDVAVVQSDDRTKIAYVWTQCLAVLHT